MKTQKITLKADNLKINQSLNVKRKEWYFVGNGECCKAVKLLAIIDKPCAAHKVGNFPLFKVDANGMIRVLTHRFFDLTKEIK